MADYLPTTDAGNFLFGFDKETGYVFWFLGCNILNKNGSLLTGNSYELKGSSYLNHYIQFFYLTTVGKYKPSLYPEIM